MSESSQSCIGIIGGSGLYAVESLTEVEEVCVRTPFGEPSGPLTLGKLAGRPVAFLARHGAGHRISPTELNFRANIYAMKQLGVDALISVSAVGSLREDVAPGQMLVPDQFIDRTRGRISTFFSGGIVAHVSFADPTCGELSRVVADAASTAGATVHRGGTYVCMEGPQFSTRAESHMYRSWGADVVGMTNLQEAKLAREAEICFATAALVTDYDCWRESDDVDVEDILATLAANVSVAKKTIAGAVGGIDDTRACGCRQALDHAIITAPDAIPGEKRAELKLLLDRALGETGEANGK